MVDVDPQFQPGLQDGEAETAGPSRERREPDLAGDAELPQDGLRACDRGGAHRPRDPVRNLQILNGGDRRPVVSVDLGVIEEQDADGEQQDERADEQAEIEMQVPGPAIQQRAPPRKPECPGASISHGCCGREALAGSGGMGFVYRYRASDRVYADQVVALKTIRADALGVSVLACSEPSSAH
jgi:hypothetical protein